MKRGAWLQEEYAGAAAEAASSVQAHLAGSHEDPAAALSAVSALRAALGRHHGATQRWAAALQVEGVRQAAAARGLAEKEAHYSGLLEAEARLREEEAELQARARQLAGAQVGPLPGVVSHAPGVMDAECEIWGWESRCWWRAGAA